MTAKTPRIIPEDDINGLRFGQLLIGALCHEGYLKPINVPADINDEENSGKAYLAIDTDLFYMENDKLEEIIQSFLSL